MAEAAGLPERHLDWEGARNVRDLGGLRAAGGQLTRTGAMVRGDAPDSLTAAGWRALQAHGIRTIIDLRNDEERRADVVPRPGGLATVHVPLEEGIGGTEFWRRWGAGVPLSTPLYYAPFLDSFPGRTAAVLAAIARAEPGGVLFHCVTGRDRAGMIAMLLLALVGVAPEDIAADYELSAERLGRVPEVEELLEREGTSAREAVLSLLAALDVEAHLRSGGLTGHEIAAVRGRLLQTASS